MNYKCRGISKLLCVLLCVAIMLTTVSCADDKQSGSALKNSDVVVRMAHSADKILQDYEYEDAELLSKFELSCYRNEYESGQLIMTAVKDIEDYTVSVGEFSNGAETIPAESFEVYHEYYHKIASVYDEESTMPAGMYPDALIPMKNAEEYQLNTVNAGNNQGVWIAVKVPKEQTAGTYTGYFDVTVNDEMIKVPATIHVIDYTLTDEVSLMSCIPVQPGWIFVGELDDTQEMYQKHLDLLNRFRLSGQYLSSYIADNVEDAAVKGRYDAELALEYYKKDSCSSYAIRVHEKLDDTYGIILQEDLFVEYLKAYIDVSIENNVNLFEKAYVFMGQICDEPELNGTEERATYNEEQYQRCLALGAEYLAEQDCEAELKLAIQEELLSMSNVVTGGMSEKLSTLDCYCPTVDIYGNGTARVDYAELRDIGKDYWWYSCTIPKIPYPTYHIDDNGVSSRVMGWMSKDYDITGYLTWELVEYHKLNLKEFLYAEELYEDVHRLGDTYGDGFLVYPGRLYGVDGPVASIRLFTLCDGMEDYEVLLDLENTYTSIGEKAGLKELLSDEILTVLYSTMYSNAKVYATSTELELARGALNELIYLAKTKEVAVEHVVVEGGSLLLSVVAPKGVSISAGGTVLTESDELGNYSRYSAQIDLIGQDASAFTIQADDASVTVNLGSKLVLLDEFETVEGFAPASEGVTFEANTMNNSDVVTATMTGAEKYNIVYNLEKNAITSKAEKLNLVLYNNGSQRVTVSAYVNGMALLDTFYLEPGENVYHFDRLQNLKWKNLKTAKSIVFIVDGSDGSQKTISFESLSVFTK